MSTWLRVLHGDPLPWLLEDETPAVRHLALRQLLDQPEDAPAVRQARAAAMHTDPLATILAAEQPARFWVKPGPGYTPKYRGTVWQLSFLDQLGADGTDPRVQAACDYLLARSQSKTGGFASWEGGSKPDAPPPRSLALHCLNGNLLRALIGFGRLEDARVQRAIGWQARAITGEGFGSYYSRAARKPLVFSRGLNGPRALPISEPPGRIAWCGTAHCSQDLQVQTPAYCRAGAGTRVCAAPLPRTLQRCSSGAARRLAAVWREHHRCQPEHSIARYQGGAARIPRHPLAGAARTC